MGVLRTSFVTTGQIVSGVCYAIPLQTTTIGACWNQIPPERVGIRGEYDHYGLAKRVRLKFQEEMGEDAIACLSIRQRGSVVILLGQVSDSYLLEDLIQLAMEVEGTTHVEVCGVQVRQFAAASA